MEARGQAPLGAQDGRPPNRVVWPHMLVARVEKPDPTAMALSCSLSAFFELVAAHHRVRLRRTAQWLDVRMTYEALTP